MNLPLHDDVAHLAGLLGTWSGRGHGSYPTIESFDYDETITFGHVGKPVIAYTQRTTLAPDGRPSHAEAGYLRAPEPGRLELILAHPTGITEVAEGSFDGTTMLLRSTTIGSSATAKPIRAVERDIIVRGDELHYVLRMSAVGLPMTLHLEATLTRSA